MNLCARTENNTIISTQPFVTELDLRIASLPAAAIDFLRQAMPSGKNDSGEAEYDYERFIDEVFT
jgi:cofilin